jgi:hypothetical protein
LIVASALRQLPILALHRAPFSTGSPGGLRGAVRDIDRVGLLINSHRQRAVTTLALATTRQSDVRFALHFAALITSTMWLL